MASHGRKLKREETVIMSTELKSKNDPLHQIVRKFIQIWSERQHERAHEVCSPDMKVYYDHNVFQVVVDWTPVVKALHECINDYHVNVHDVFGNEQNGKFVLIFEHAGEWAKEIPEVPLKVGDNTPLSMISVGKVIDGKVVEERVYTAAGTNPAVAAAHRYIISFLHMKK